MVHKGNLFFPQTVHITPHDPDFEDLESHISQIIANAEDGRKTFLKEGKGNDIPYWDSIIVIYNNPKTFITKLRGIKKIEIKSLTLPLTHITGNAPEKLDKYVDIVINNELPVYSTDEHYDLFLSQIMSHLR